MQQLGPASAKKATELQKLARKSIAVRKAINALVFEMKLLL